MHLLMMLLLLTIEGIYLSSLYKVNGYKFGQKSGIEGWLEDHNYFRCMHGAGELKWSDALAKRSLNQAKRINSIEMIEHSDSYNGIPPGGENTALSGGTKCSKGIKDYNQSCAVWLWHNEYTEYWHNNKGYRWQDNLGQIGHATAMLWKNIDIIGCGMYGRGYVCQYGNSKCVKNTYECWKNNPAQLPNFNMGQCKDDGSCVERWDSNRLSKCSGYKVDVKKAIRQGNLAIPPSLLSSKAYSPSMPPSHLQGITTLLQAQESWKSLFSIITLILTIPSSLPILICVVAMFA